MSSIKQRFTREGANLGAVLNLTDDNGKETGDWIKCRGIDSDAFQRQNRIMRRDLLAYQEKAGGIEKCRASEEYQDYVREQTVKLRASLVMEWSFDEPCTPENVALLFTEAPGIAEEVDQFAGKRGKFVKPLPSN